MQIKDSTNETQAEAVRACTSYRRISGNYLQL
nr:MAG TPA: hypothetical protein [Caudoviricetes sp.]